MDNYVVLAFLFISPGGVILTARISFDTVLNKTGKEEKPPVLREKLRGFLGLVLTSVRLFFQP